MWNHASECYSPNSQHPTYYVIVSRDRKLICEVSPKPQPQIETSQGRAAPSPVPEPRCLNLTSPVTHLSIWNGRVHCRTQFVAFFTLASILN